MRVEWSQMARQDLMAIVDHILEDNPLAAWDVHDRIVQQTGVLSQHPKLGRPGRVKDTRELVISGLPYLIPYRIDGAEQVTLLRVLHTARQWPD